MRKRVITRIENRWMIAYATPTFKGVEIVYVLPKNGIAYKCGVIDNIKHLGVRTDDKNLYVKYLVIPTFNGIGNKDIEDIYNKCVRYCN